MQFIDSNSLNSRKDPKKNVRYPIRVYVVVSLLFVLLLMVCIRAFSISSEIEIITDENMIVQNTNFDFKANLKPNTIYPSGIFSPGDYPLFINITEELIVTFEADVQSTEPVTVIGNGAVNLILEADGLWQHSIPISEENRFEKIGNDNQIIHKSMTINLSELTTLIEQIDEEVGVRSSRMQLKIQPEVTGEVFYNGEKFPLHLEEALIFDYSSRQITMIGENEFTNSIPIINKEIVNQKFSIFRFELPLLLTRVVSFAGMIASLIFLIIEGRRFALSKKVPLSEADLIIKKHGSKFIELTENVNLKNLFVIEISTFNSFLKISEERELPILMCDDKMKRLLKLYIIDQGVIYGFSTPHQIQYEESSKNVANYEVS